MVFQSGNICVYVGGGEAGEATVPSPSFGNFKHAFTLGAPCTETNLRDSVTMWIRRWFFNRLYVCRGGGSRGGNRTVLLFRNLLTRLHFGSALYGNEPS